MLVSAIMPTRGRPELSRRCLDSWRAQTWEEKELIILDDSEKPSFPDGVHEPGVNYQCYAVGRLSIGDKRNHCAFVADGDIVIHFDSDDIYGPERISDQVARLESTGKAVTSYRNIKFTDGQNWWKNTNWPGGYGASLCYRRDWWQKHPFPDTSDGEDWQFVQAAMQANEFVAGDAGDMMVASIHPGNTSPRVIGPGWIPLP